MVALLRRVTRLLRSLPAEPGPTTYVAPAIVEVDVKIPTKGKYKTPDKKARGCVVHYTARPFDRGATDAKSTLQFLAAQGLGCLVMDRDGIIYKAQGWDEVAYHAGPSTWKDTSGVSLYCMGMEIMNAGMLEKHGDTFHACFGGEIPPGEVREVQAKDNIKAGFYHRYTKAQEDALINFLLWQIETRGMDIDWIVGHDEVAPDRKQDPGGSLSLTMPELRALLKSRRDAAQHRSSP
ncbi:MAG TPA: N-acetylmuramoyl-L-alanine amidase [Methylomirabilota bacterium]|nr:N-acetylmuramoyl-L-alanine amidase [Methylomirabilota bacterium]